MSGKSQSLISKSGMLFLSRMLGFVVLIGTHAYLTRALGVAEYGDFRKLLLVVLTVPSLVTYGFQESIVFLLRDRPQQRSLVLASSNVLYLCVGLVVALLTHAFGKTLASSLHMESLQPFNGALALYFLCSIAAIPGKKFLIADERFGLASALIFIPDALMLAAACLCIGLLHNSALFLWILIAIRVAECAVQLGYSLYTRSFHDPHTNPGVQRATFTLSGLKSVSVSQLRFGLPIGVGCALDLVRLESHKFGASIFMPAEGFSLFVTGCLKVPFVESILFALGDALTVQFTGPGRTQSPDILANVWKQLIEKLALVFYPMATFLIIMAPDIFEFLYGAPFRTSGTVFRILTVSLFFSFTCANIILRIHVRNKKYILGSLATCFFNLVLLTLLLKHTPSASVAAFIALFSTLLMEGWIFLRALSICQLRLKQVVPFERLCRLFLAIAFSGFALISFEPALNTLHPLAHLLLSGLVFGFLYAFFLIVCGVVSLSHFKTLLKWTNKTFERGALK